MPLGKPKTYTERVGVALTNYQRDRLRVYARQHQTGVAVVMREAALAKIGRADLSVAETTAWFRVGVNVDREHDRERKPGHAARVIVNLTRAQQLALQLAAELGETSVSTLLREAALETAGLPLSKPKPGAVGR